jgi:multiple antibiotic resistance protein
VEINLFLSTMVSLFVVVDPVGTSAVFMSLTQGFGAKEQRRIAARAVVVAVFLLFFSLLQASICLTTCVFLCRLSG